MRCGGFVKDKFFFGLLHFCLTEEEYEQKLEAERKQLQSIVHRKLTLDETLSHFGLGKTKRIE
jgi:hypothetical protein